MADLAHRRKLEGQICADALHCHIASDDRIRETSEQPARLSGQMASHHLPSRLEEADVKGSQHLGGETSGLTKRPRTLPPPTPEPPTGSISRLISKAWARAVQHLWTHHLLYTALSNSCLFLTPLQSNISQNIFQ